MPTTFAQNKAKLRRSQNQEKAIARDVGGRRTPGSGSQDHSKGDVSTGEFLIEAKQTVTNSYSLKLATWRAIKNQATRKSKEPAMVIELAGVKLAVIDYNRFLAFGG